MTNGVFARILKLNFRVGGVFNDIPDCPTVGSISIV
jgi:hypothetical protein